MSNFNLEGYGHVSIEKVVKAIGVPHVTTIRPYRVKKSIEAIKEALDTDMSFIEFVLSVGCKNCNWNQSWSFVNHDEEFILFSVSDNLENENGQLIHSEDWRYSSNGRESQGFTQAIKHLELIEIAGYQLKTFSMAGSNSGEERAKIKSIQPRMFDKKLKRIGKDWYAFD